MNKKITQEILKQCAELARQVVIFHQVYGDFDGSGRDGLAALEKLTKLFDDHPRLGLSDYTMEILERLDSEAL